jgi:hypothetical protein
MSGVDGKVAADFGACTSALAHANLPNDDLAGFDFFAAK